MRLATTILGTAMGTTAILYILWIYSIGTFVATATTEVDLAADLTDLAYLVLGAAILQILSAGLARDLPWGSLLTAALAMIGYFIAALDGPEVFIAWTVSGVVMACCLLVDMTLAILRTRGERESDPSPIWALNETDEKPS